MITEIRWSETEYRRPSWELIVKPTKGTISRWRHWNVHLTKLHNVTVLQSAPLTISGSVP